MAEMRQSPTERQALHEAWEAHPEVVEFTEHAEAFAWKHNLAYNAEGLNRMLSEFSTSWFAEHGPLPDTGILVG